MLRNRAWGARHANCGYISLSHVLPLHGPGVLSKTLKAMIRPNSPFSIPPRFDPVLWSWLLRFAKRCNARDAAKSARGLAALLGSTGRLYDELFDREQFDCEFERVGCLFVFHDAHHMEQYKDVDDYLRRDFQVGAERFDRASLLEFEPALTDRCAGGWFYPQDRHVRPDRLVDAWLAKLCEMGVEVRSEFRMQGFVGTDLADGIRSDSGEVVQADQVVMATGAMLPQFNQTLGCRLPIQPGKGYSITMPRPSICPKRPLIFQDHKVAVTPMQSAYRVGSTMEFSGYDTRLNRKRLQILRDAAAIYLREPAAEPVEEEWYGWRSMTVDGLPFIDRAPAWKNVWVAAGHNMLGLTMAPVTGQLIAEMLGGRDTHIDASPYAIVR